MLRRHLARLFSSGQGSVAHLETVRHQLRRVREMQQRVAAVNSPSGKSTIISEYPDLRHLLEQIYQPKFLLHMTPQPLRRHLSNLHPTSSQASPSLPSPPSTLFDLFTTLSFRSTTGTAAKDLVAAFLLKHEVIDRDYIRQLAAEGVEGVVDPPELEVFMRLLEKNLVAGFGARTLSKVSWSEDPGSTSTSASTTETTPGGLSAHEPRPSEKRTTTSSSHSYDGPKSTSTASLKNFSCALGKSIEPPFTSLFKPGAPSWYASRKLDGVRCLTLVDLLVPSDPLAPLETVGVSFLSRSGNAFSTLSVLEEQVKLLSGMPGLREWLDPDQVVDVRDEGVVKRLVLDGEVCVMRELSPAEMANRVTTEDTKSGTHSGASSLWSSSLNLVEDFPATVSQIRRKSGSIPHPAYFLFDVLSWSEVDAHGAVPGTPGLGMTFSERVERSRKVAAWLEEKVEENRVGEKCVRMLEQYRVKEVGEVEGMVGRAAEEGWEGLVLRADRPYKGKRSSDVLKFKQWKDAEYTVLSIDTSTMRLSIDGVYGEHEACSNVWIEHKGVPVSVGSGFTTDQRLRYARDPGLVVGKQITAEYFAESESTERERKSAVGKETGEGSKPQMSLRFPRVKHVWEEGKRNV